MKFTRVWGKLDAFPLRLLLALLPYFTSLELPGLYPNFNQGLFGCSERILWKGSFWKTYLKGLRK